MATHTRRMLGLAAAFILAAGAADAQGKGQDKGKGAEKSKAAKEARDDRDGRDGRAILRGDRDRGGDRDGRTVYGNGRKTPPGLAKKPGGMPPGQYKKRYSTTEGSSVLRDILLGRGYRVVRTENAGALQYVYYRGTDGVMRRAVVRQGDDDRLHFGNLPQAITREVLLRLY